MASNSDSAAAAGVGDLTAEMQALTAVHQQYNAELGTSTQLGNQFAKSLSTAFVGLAMQGKSLGDVLRSLALNISQMALTAAFKPLTNAFANSFTSMISSPSPFSAGGTIAAPSDFSSGAGSLFASLGGAAAESPAAAPAAAAAGASPSIVFNVTTPDVAGFSRSETQIAALLARTVAQGNRNL